MATKIEVGATSGKSFKINGLDYQAGAYEILYRDVEFNSSGDVNETIIRVGLKNTVNNAVLQNPILIAQWVNGSDTPYADLSSLVTDLTNLAFKSGGGNGIGVVILGSDTVVNILAKDPSNAGTAWVALDTGVDDNATPVAIGDALATDGTLWTNIGPIVGEAGDDGLGWTGGSYAGGTGIVTFTSTDGLGFATGDLRGATGADGVPAATLVPQTRTTSGGETTWVVTGDPIPTTHQLFADGSKLVNTVDYTYSGNTFTFDASYLPIAVEEQEYYPNVAVGTGDLDTTGNSIVGDAQTATGDGTTTIDWGLGNTFNFQFGAFNEVFTFTAPSKAGTFLLKLVQDGVGSRTVTFPATVKWSGGTAPTLTTTATTGTDVITFYFDGTNYFAVEVLDFS